MRALWLLALLLAVPVVGADHVFSHRIYVVGRIVDAEGLPPAGLAVTVDFEGLVADARCFDSKPEVAGPRGDYEICRHAHDLPPEVRVIVTAGGASREGALDPHLRHAPVSLQLDVPSPSRDLTGQREFQRAFLVTGRSFTLLPAPSNEEGVRVNATPMGDEVTARLMKGERVVAEGTGTIDEYGRYAIDLDVDELPEGALVRVTNGRESAEALASPLFRRADLNLVRDLRLSQGQGEGAPGSETPLPGALALAALVATAACLARRR